MENLDIAKFGGTSVKDYDAMLSSYKVVVANPNTRVVVISACSGVTNILVELASGACSSKKIDELIGKLRSIHTAIIEKLDNQEDLKANLESHLKEIYDLTQEANMGRSDALTDRIVSHGELMSTYIFAALFNHMGTQATWFDIRRIMRTDSNFGCAAPLVEVLKAQAQEKLLPLYQDGKSIIITQGFIGANSEGQTTTLGRGGSDYSASLLGSFKCRNHIYLD